MGKCNPGSDGSTLPEPAADGPGSEAKAVIRLMNDCLLHNRPGAENE